MQRHLLSITRDGRKVTGRSNSRERKAPRFDPIRRELCDLSLRPRQQQREQFRAAFAVDYAVDEVGPEAPLEGDYRLLLVGNVIAEAFERKQEAGVSPIRVDQVARRARQRKAALGQSMPWEQFAGVFLAPRGDIGMANDVAAADAVTLLDVGDQRDQRSDLLVGKRAVAELMTRIDDLDADAGRIDVGDSAPARLAGVPGALRFVDEAIDRSILVDQIVA